MEMRELKERLKSGTVDFLGFSFSWRLAKTRLPSPSFNPLSFDRPYCLHFGPGPKWTKPNNQWINVDVNPDWGDLAIDFNAFESLPLPAQSVRCIYGSHVFEHMSIWVTDRVFSECCRVLQAGGVLRLVLPDVDKSIREYLARNENFPLFRRRRERARSNYQVEYTLFDCLREDFISRSSQTNLLGQKALAHQNAWDFESISAHLRRAGFSEIHRCELKKSTCDFFPFEGSYECEAMEDNRSLYVEATKR